YRALEPRDLGGMQTGLRRQLLMRALRGLPVSPDVRGEPLLRGRAHGGHPPAGGPMSTEPIAQALERLELAGAYHRAARARQIGVPQIELAALEHLEASGGLTPGELGHRLGLTSGGVTALTGRLVDAGYIARDRHPDDGRMRVLTLSPVGT